jgi:phosphonopyruvate decarboxylase
MLDCPSVYDKLRTLDIGLFAGVPDSLLKNFCAYITDHAEDDHHLITANEGAAIGLATGYHLATGKLALVYMQNSGQGNAINPLVSLADPDVYSIPMLLLIGWRGEPGHRDEPQHTKQGKITLALLECLDIPYKVLPETLDEALSSIDEAVADARRLSAPVALVVRKGTFAPYSLTQKTANPYTMSREEVVRRLVESLPSSAVIVSTTGKASRELFEIRASLGHPPGGDFLTVGSMGHASHIALGVARAQPKRQVYCLDGDGALLMHMGALATIGSAGPTNFKHLLINNGAHESVGGQPTAGFDVDFPAIAKACGYRVTDSTNRVDELASKLDSLSSSEGPSLLEIRTQCGARAELGRPTTTPLENKQTFMRRLRP